MEDIDNHEGGELLRTATKQENHEMDEKQKAVSYKGLFDLIDFESDVILV